MEEGAKLPLLVGAARGDWHLDEPFDWIVYGVSVALGFAAMENLGWLASDDQVGWLGRSVTAVPSHALDGTIMGYYLGRAMRDGPAGRARRYFLALAVPALWHGLYDFIVYWIIAEGDSLTRSRGSGRQGIQAFLSSAMLRVMDRLNRPMWEASRWSAGRLGGMGTPRLSGAEMRDTETWVRRWYAGKWPGADKPIRALAAQHGRGVRDASDSAACLGRVPAGGPIAGLRSQAPSPSRAR